MRIPGLAIPLTMALLAMAACSAPVPPGPEPQPGPGTAPPVPDTCGAAAFMDLIGTPLDGFDASLAKGPVRVIAPSSIVTQEYSAERINIFHDSRMVIVRIDCG